MTMSLNPENAFRHLSDAELWRNAAILKLVGSPHLVASSAFLLNAAFKLHLPVAGLVKRTVFKHFCGGETLAECRQVQQELAKHDIACIFDYAAENQSSEKAFEKCTAEVIASIHLAAEAKIPLAVFKVTGLASSALLAKIGNGITLSDAEQNAWERAKARAFGICSTAAAHGVSILIDAEESWLQDAIDALCEELMAAFNQQKPVVYTTVQMYRHDRLTYIKELLQDASYVPAIKLVRGAYLEKERLRAEEQGYVSPLYATKEETDQAYDLALQLLIQEEKHIGLMIATHNEKSTLLAMELLAHKKHKDTALFCQLFGMGDHLSYNLAIAGFFTAKYVPYGPVKDSIPYLIRRAAENTGIKGQMGRELALIHAEQQRRKHHTEPEKSYGS